MRSRSTPMASWGSLAPIASTLFGVVVASGTTACLGVEDPVEAEPALEAASDELLSDRSRQLPNNFPFVNVAGTAATYSSAGFVDLESAFHVPQGTNGRSCESCHLPQVGWSIKPVDVEILFWLTDGTAPIFNLLDANSPNADVSTKQARYESYSMLRKGLFRRGGTLPASADFEIVAVDDPLGAGGSLTSFQAYRRPLATANFHIAKNVGWHDQNTNGSGNVHAGLVAQAAGNITGSQQGPSADPAIVDEIVAYEEGLSFAQQYAWGVRLDVCGGKGGPENLAAQPAVSGPFDLYSAWIGITPGSCTTKAADKKRAQIARGQQLFNATNQNGRSCSGCHNAANNGSNVNGTLFDIGASRAEFREPGMPLYTVRNKATLEERQTTDPGRALRSGLWANLDRFKTPSLRGLSARAPYFHNGIAKTLEDVVVHYETALGFVYTKKERDDLVAFLEAL